MEEPKFLWIGLVPPEMRGDGATVPSEIAVADPGDPGLPGIIYRPDGKGGWEKRNDSGRIAAVNMAREIATQDHKFRPLVAAALFAEMQAGRAEIQPDGKPTEGALTALRLIESLGIADDVSAMIPEVCPITGLPERLF